MVLVSDNSDRDAGARLRAGVPRHARGGRDHHAGGQRRGRAARAQRGRRRRGRPAARRRSPCDAVVIDNERGAREATAHLLDARAPPDRAPRRRHRLDDRRRAAARATALAHADAGVAVDERLIVPIGFHAPDAEQRIARLLDERAPTAIFAANNLLAEHAWHVLRRTTAAAAARHLARRLRRRAVDVDGRARHHRRRAADGRDGPTGCAAAAAPDRRPGRAQPASSCLEPALDRPRLDRSA